MVSDDPTRGQRPPPGTPPSPGTPPDNAEGRAATTMDTPLHSAELPDSVSCPFCEDDDTEQFSAFGGQASTSQYYCNRCRTVFDCFRWR